jgi:hypothetical protein
VSIGRLKVSFIEAYCQRINEGLEGDQDVSEGNSRMAIWLYKELHTEFKVLFNDSFEVLVERAIMRLVHHEFVHSRHSLVAITPSLVVEEITCVLSEARLQEAATA